MAPREVDVAFLEERRLDRDLKTIDFASVWAAAAERSPVAVRERGGPCPVCHGGFGPVLDAVELIRGSAFLCAHSIDGDVLELRQFSSSRHGDDLDSVPPMDAIAIF